MSEITAGGPHRDAVAPGVDLERVWTRVSAEVWQRDAGWLERLSGKLLRSPGLARALLTTPSLLLPWLIASLVVLGAGAAATSSAGEPLVGLLAPALAAAGIAYAYGPGIDPAWELSRSMAVSDRMVLLVRALGVFAVDAALGIAASAASGTAAGITFGWLVPMTAVSLLALAAATLARSANVGVAAGLSAWCIAVLAGKAADGRYSFAIADHALIPFYAACAVVFGAVVLYATRTPRAASPTRTPRGMS